jgi:hypothetical protein
MGNNRSYLPLKGKPIKSKKKTKTNKKVKKQKQIKSLPPPIFIVEMGLRDKGL